ncbi:MAG TPA: CU044_2847 family protein [Thermoleophilaceae bacterium]|nr:CU044_2847 family protein [Thermoleophilaceae bacterium]
MTRFMEVPTASGGTVTIEVEEAAGGRTMRGSAAPDLIERSAHTLQESLGGVASALRDIVDELHGSAEVRAIDLELGLSLSGEAGFVVAKGAAEANFRVVVHWERPADEPGA